MKKTKLLLAIVTILTIALFISCDKKSGKEKNPATGETVEIDVASSWGTWNYFSFSQGKIIGTGAANSETDAEWKTRTDWDIAFTRMYAKTNSGESGSGKGGVIEISADNNDKANVFANLTEAPTSGYIVDAISDDNDGEGMLVAMPPVYYKGGTSKTINGWLVMAGMALEPSPKVFAMKTGDDKYVKIYLKAYQNDAGEKNRVIMEYVYQADGTTNLSTSN